MRRKITAQLISMNAIVLAGIYSYLLRPNPMDILWGVSLSCCIVLMGHSIYRNLSMRYIAVSTASVGILVVDFTSGMEDFWIFFLNINFHGLVGRLSLLTLLVSFIVFVKGDNRDLKLLAGLGFAALFWGGIWGALMAKGVL